MIVAAAALLIFGIIAGLAATGRLGDLQYANIPLIHPYPPTGYFINPFGTSKADLVSSSEAARVRNDLAADGQQELLATQAGDPALLALGDTGNRLAKMSQVVDQNNRAGVVEAFTNHLTSVKVGHLPDPNDSSITFCVEEVGTSEVRYTARAGGALIRTVSTRFDDKFWLVKVDGRYLIADALINSEITGA